jgi:hypothetical protein
MDLTRTTPAIGAPDLNCPANKRMLQPGVSPGQYCGDGRLMDAEIGHLEVRTVRVPDAAPPSPTIGSELILVGQNQR